MSLKVGELHATLGLQDSQFHRGLDRAGGKWSKFGGTLLRAGGTMGVAAGAALAAGAAKGVGEFASLEKGMNEVFTLMPDISGQAMGQMTQQVRDFSKEFGTLPSDVVPSLYQAISAGVPKDNVFEFMETAQKAAIGGVTELETAVDGISSVVNAYGDQIGGAAEASDLMFTAVRLGKTNFDELSRSLFNVLPTASSLGVQFGDVTAAMAAMTSQGTPTNVATTQMRQMLVELSKAGSGTATMFEELTGKSFQEFIKGGGNVEDALQVLAKGAEKEGKSIADVFGSVEAGMAATALTSESGAEAFSDALAEMDKSAGATDKAFGQMDQGLSRSWDKIKTVVNDAILEIGQRLAPFVQKAADWLADKLPKAIDAFTDAWNAAARIIGPVISAVSGMFSGLSSSGSNMSSRLSEVFDAVRQRIQVAVGIISDVVGALTEWFNENRAQIEEIWGKVRRVIETALEAIAAVTEAVTTAIAFIWDNWGDTIISMLKTAWSTISGVISGALTVIQGILDVFIGILTGDWSRAWGGVKDILAGVWEIITSIVSGAVGQVEALIGGMLEKIGQWFRELPGNIVSWLGDAGGVLVGWGKNLMEGLWGGIKSMAGWLKDKVISMFKNILPGWVKNALGISSPSKLFADLGKELPAGLIKGMNAGMSEVRRVAESMASAAIPKMQPQVAGAGGNNITNNWNIPVHAATPEQGAQYVGSIASVQRRVETM